MNLTEIKVCEYVAVCTYDHFCAQSLIPTQTEKQTVRHLHTHTTSCLPEGQKFVRGEVETY